MDNKPNSSKTISTLDRGASAEAKALQFLETQGYGLVERNFRWRGGELDLIMIDPLGVLVFVEVRSASRRSEFLRYSLGPVKRKHLRDTISKYLFQKKRTQKAYRFDAVWIESGRVEHWKNIQI